jgi:hypothetical protein
MEFDGYRGADDVEEEVRNVGEGTDLFTHYAIGLPILMRVRYSRPLCYLFYFIINIY